MTDTRPLPCRTLKHPAGRQCVGGVPTFSPITHQAPEQELRHQVLLLLWTQVARALQAPLQLLLSLIHDEGCCH